METTSMLWICVLLALWIPQGQTYSKDADRRRGGPRSWAPLDDEESDMFSGDAGYVHFDSNVGDPMQFPAAREDYRPGGKVFIPGIVYEPGYRPKETDFDEDLIDPKDPLEELGDIQPAMLAAQNEDDADTSLSEEDILEEIRRKLALDAPPTYTYYYDYYDDDESENTPSTTAEPTQKNIPTTTVEKTTKPKFTMAKTDKSDSKIPVILPEEAEITTKEGEEVPPATEPTMDAGVADEDVQGTSAQDTVPQAPTAKPPVKPIEPAVDAPETHTPISPSTIKTTTTEKRIPAATTKTTTKAEGSTTTTKKTTKPKPLSTTTTMKTTTTKKTATAPPSTITTKKTSTTKTDSTATTKKTTTTATTKKTTTTPRASATTKTTTTTTTTPHSTTTTMKTTTTKPRSTTTTRLTSRTSTTEKKQLGDVSRSTTATNEREHEPAEQMTRAPSVTQQQESTAAEITGVPDVVPRAAQFSMIVLIICVISFVIVLVLVIIVIFIVRARLRRRGKYDISSEVESEPTNGDAHNGKAVKFQEDADKKAVVTVQYNNSAA